MKIGLTVIFLVFILFESNADSQLSIEEKITEEYRQGCVQRGWVPDCLEVAGYKCFKNDQMAPHKMICRSPAKAGPMLFLTYDEKQEYWNIRAVQDQ